MARENVELNLEEEDTTDPEDEEDQVNSDAIKPPEGFPDGADQPSIDKTLNRLSLDESSIPTSPSAKPPQTTPAEGAHVPKYPTLNSSTEPNSDNEDEADPIILSGSSSKPETTTRPEISKKDKRRAREAVKKAQEAETVSSTQVSHQFFSLDCRFHT